MCLLGFAGFLRFSEIVNIRFSDVNIQASCVEINIVKSKTDVYKSGQKVCIARTYCDTCPVNMLEKYLALLNFDMHCSQYLFRSLSFCKKSKDYKLRSDDRPISYTRAREIILEAFGKIGLHKSKFGLHSLRSGGATSATALGVVIDCLKSMGGGGRTKLRTATLEKICQKNCQSPKVWAYNMHIIINFKTLLYLRNY